MSKPSDAPYTSEEFNKVYSSVSHWMWSDIRIPRELKTLIQDNKPKTSLELGCGLGRFSRFVAGQGIQATGVDFSSVAIENAKRKLTLIESKSINFLVGDVTNLELLSEKFDVSFDVGCFHCLDKEGQKKYVSEIYRLLKPGAIHLIWALDTSPSDIKLSPDYMKQVFDKGFYLDHFKFSRRRILPSHWYWLIREK
jgi:ubiquinone/menaquinone biosynthesis C-methylase UbiE